MTRLNAKAANRRIVLLPEGSPLDADHETVLAEVEASAVHAEIGRLAEKHEGAILAAEWLSPLGWRRWLWRRG